MEYAIAIVVLVVVVYAYFQRSDTVTSARPTPSPAPVSKPKAVRKAKVVADKNNNGITSKAELKTLTKVQLLELADKKSLKVKRSGSKAAVINEIHSQLRNNDNDGDDAEEL